MKNLKDFIKEEMIGGSYATPSNTIGMGNMSMPTDTQLGSGDIPQCLDIRTGKIYKKRKRFKRYKI